MFNFFSNESVNGSSVIKNNNTNNFDILQKARKDLAGEIEAIIEYDNHIHSVADGIVKDTWTNIKHEELVHSGELIALINYLSPEDKQYLEKGIKEFSQRMTN